LLRRIREGPRRRRDSGPASVVISRSVTFDRLWLGRDVWAALGYNSASADDNCTPVFNLDAFERMNDSSLFSNEHRTIESRPPLGEELLPPVEPPSARFIIQLFVVPALIVALIVAVWLAF